MANHPDSGFLLQKKTTEVVVAITGMGKVPVKLPPSIYGTNADTPHMLPMAFQSPTSSVKACTEAHARTFFNVTVKNVGFR